MGNLVRYTLSWSLFLFTLGLWSGPFIRLLEKLSTGDFGKIALSAAIVGGALIYGYLANLVPLSLFQHCTAVGLFATSVSPGWSSLPDFMNTKEMKAHCFLLKARLAALTDAGKVTQEARLARSDKWTHLIIHYNLIGTMLLAVIVWLTFAVCTNDWTLGGSVLVGKECSGFQRLLSYGFVAVAALLLWYTSQQIRWQLIQMNRIELDRLKEIQQSPPPRQAGC